MIVALIRSEILKTKRSNLVAAIVFFPAFTAFAVGLLQLAYAPKTGAEFLFALSMRLWALFMLPLMSLAVATVVSQIEHADRTWDYVMSQKVNRFAIYSIKLLIVLACVLCSSFILFVSIASIELLHSSFQLYTVLLPMLVKLALNISSVFFGNLWLCTIQTWICLRFRTIIPSIIVSAGMLFFGVAGIMISPLIGRVQFWMLFIPSVPPYATISGEIAWRYAIYISVLGGIISFTIMQLSFHQRLSSRS